MSQLTLQDLDAGAVDVVEEELPEDDENEDGIDELMQAVESESDENDVEKIYAAELESGLFGSGAGSDGAIREMAAAFSRASSARAERLERVTNTAALHTSIAEARLSAQEAALARAEAATWDLVATLYPRRRQSQQETQTMTSSDAAATVQRALQDDCALHELHEVVRWLERCAGSAAGGRTAAFDVPDESDAGEKELVERCWTLVRAGNVTAAASLCRDARRPWRAASLTGGELWDGDRRGNPRRTLWRNACCAVASDSALPALERALYGILGGDLSATLVCCDSWQDHLWARLRVLFDAEVDALLLQQQQAPSATFHDVFAALHTAPSDRVQRECDDFFHVCQEHIVLDDFATLLPALAKWCTAASDTQKTRSLPQAYATRLAAHLVAFFHHDAVRSQRLPEDASHIIAEYAALLATTSHWDHVALYSSLLPPGECVEVYSQLLATASATAVSQDRREKLIRAADRAGIPFRSVTSRVAELLAHDVSAGKTSQQQVGEGDVGKMVEAVRWLSFDASQWIEAVAAANTFTRDLLGRGNIEAARRVIDALPITTKTQKTRKTPEEKELAWTRAYIAARDTFDRWHQHHSRSPPIPPSMTMAAASRGGFAESLVRENETRAYEAEHRRWAADDVQLAGDADQVLVTALNKGRPLQQTLTATVCPLATELLACLCAVRRVWPPPAAGTSTPCAGLPALLTKEPHPLLDSLSDDRLKSFLLLFRELALSSLQ